jgi:hypothetical protein
VLLRAAAALAGLALVVPGTAAAHAHSSRVAADYRATVSPLSPNLSRALSVRLYRADLAVRVTALGAHRVVVLGYLGEPFLRLGPGGLFVNAASPTAAGTRLVAPRPGSGGPLWQLHSRRPSVVWHDARVRGLPAGTSRGGWSISILVDGKRAHLAGTLVRVPPPSGWAWLAIGSAFAALTALLLALRSGGALRAGAALLGVVSGTAALVGFAGFAASSTATEGTWVEGGNEAFFILAAAVVLLWGSRDAKALAGGFMGVVGLAWGLPKLPVFFHGIVLSALPPAVARLSVVVGIAAGAAAVILGLVVLFDVVEHYEEPEIVERYL